MVALNSLGHGPKFGQVHRVVITVAFIDGQHLGVVEVRQLAKERGNGFSHEANFQSRGKFLRKVSQGAGLYLAHRLHVTITD